jgi:hypothetical protein
MVQVKHRHRETLEAALIVADGWANASPRKATRGRAGLIQRTFAICAEPETDPGPFGDPSYCGAKSISTLHDSLKSNCLAAIRQVMATPRAQRNARRRDEKSATGTANRQLLSSKSQSGLCPNVGSWTVPRCAGENSRRKLPNVVAHSWGGKPARLRLKSVWHDC